MATYVNTTIHFPDPELLERIRAAAKRLGISPGAFMREASERSLQANPHTARYGASTKKTAKKRAA